MQLNQKLSDENEERNGKSTVRRLLFARRYFLFHFLPFAFCLLLFRFLLTKESRIIIRICFTLGASTRSLSSASSRRSVYISPEFFGCGARLEKGAA